MDDLLSWTKQLDFDEYHENWKSVATSGAPRPRPCPHRRRRCCRTRMRVSLCGHAGMRAEAPLAGARDGRLARALSVPSSAYSLFDTSVQAARTSTRTDFPPHICRSSAPRACSTTRCSCKTKTRRCRSACRPMAWSPRPATMAGQEARRSLHSTPNVCAKKVKQKKKGPAGRASTVYQTPEPPYDYTRLSAACGLFVTRTRKVLFAFAT